MFKNILSFLIFILSLSSYVFAGTYTVTNTNDSGANSLRDAINRANSSAEKDSIVFNIPMSDPNFDAVTGVWTISPLTPLPSSPSHGLFIISGKNTIRGLIINRFMHSGILLSGPSANDNLIIENFIGVNSIATDVQPNGQYGVYIVEGARNSVGWLPDIPENAIKTDRKQTAQSGKEYMRQKLNGGGNLIAGNLGGGIYISGEVAKENGIYANNITWNFSHGVQLHGSASNTHIFLNEITYNQGIGVLIEGINCVQNTILSNAITRNDSAGILLDEGNLMMPTPEIQAVTDDSVMGIASPDAFIQIFTDPENEGELLFGETTCDANGNFIWTGFVVQGNITATATDINGNTSPFSLPYAYGGDILVTTTMDDGPGSLREAILEADVRPGPNRILFQIPMTDNGYDPNTGVWSIQPVSGLPYIGDDDLVIDGYSQSIFIGADTNPEGPEIEIDGSLTTDARGIMITGSRAVIAALAINRFDDAGIFVYGAEGGLVTGCYIGIDAKGTEPAGNDEGITLYRNARDFVIGAPDSTYAGNIISYNSNTGIMIQDSCKNNYIIGNIIGPDVTGTAMSTNNLHGVYITDYSDSNYVFQNQIGFSTYTGVYVNRSSYCHIEGNEIGTDETWQRNMGNQDDGIFVSNSSSCRMIKNTIGFNHSNGIVVAGQEAVNNLISQNAISKNEMKGIEIAEGGNNGILPPTFLSVSSTQILGTAGGGQIVEIFNDDDDEGQLYLGSTMADAAGNFTFTLSSSPQLTNITATATDIDGNTSAFSLPYGQGGNILVTTTADGGPGSLREAILEAENRPGPNRIVFQIPMTDHGYDTNRGVWTIQPATALPWIVDDNLYLDGYSQSMFIGTDTNPEGPEIEIDGSLTNEVHGICIRGSGVTIAGLVINRFNGAGIWVWDVLGGLVTGCYLGINARGTEPVGNFDGISLYRNVCNFMIGAPDSTYAGNIISGNTSFGISIRDSCKNNIIIGNRIGPNRIGSAMSANNLHGMYIEFSDSNYIYNNQIGCNRNLGIYINKSDYCHIERNEIGTDGTWQLNMGNQNDGILVENSASNRFVNNTIGFNKSSGIEITGPEATGNIISQNAISKNEMKGIELTFGGNEGISPPTILSATVTQVTGTTGGGQTVEIFSDDGNQGQFYLGSVVADAAGNFSFAVSSSPLLTNITATTLNSSGNTSEFSPPVKTNIETFTSERLPKEFVLHHNYPNPFNASSIITFELPYNSYVKLKIYNLMGKEVETLISGNRKAGLYKVEWSPTHIPSGIYFCRLEAGNYIGTKKLILQK